MLRDAWYSGRRRPVGPRSACHAESIRDWPDVPRPAATVTVVEGDVRDRSGMAEILASERVDTVVHLAAQTLVGPALVDPVDTFRHNIEGTWQLLEACRSQGTVRRIVVASSDKAYGDAGGEAYHEEMPLRPRAPYDTSKAAADLLAQTYAHTYEMPIAVSRCANLYGPGDRNWSRVVPGTIRAVLEDEVPVICSDGSPIRDYLFVGDASSGLIALAEAVGTRVELRGMPMNFSAENHLSVREVVGLILEVMGSAFEPRVLGEATHGFRPRLYVPTARRANLGGGP